MKKLKSMDMKYHWLRCRISQQQFRHYWAAGKTNLADYFTEHHPPIHHQTTRGTFFTDISQLSELRKQHTSYAVTSTPCSKGVLDRLGRTKSVEYYEKTLTGKKPLNAKQSYCARRQYVSTNNMLARLNEIQRRNIVCALSA